MFLKICYKFTPLFAHLNIEFAKQFDAFVAMHFLMNFTIVLTTPGWLEALWMLAAYNLALLRLVLPKVQSFCRKHL